MDGIETRICKNCGKEKPLTNEYYSYANKAKGKYQTMCKECFSQFMHERWLAIKEENGERLERVKQNRQRYIDKDPEKEAERLREKARRQYYEHKEEKTQQRKRWEENNKEHIKQYYREHCKARYKSDPLYKFTIRMRNMINASFTRYDTYKPRKNADVIGMSSKELRDYLLQTFKDVYGYDWDYKEPTAIDHIIPLASANSQEEIAKLCHYTNLRLIKAKDNAAKGCRTDYIIQ